jgi:signal transduction histidine kinase
MAVSSHQKKPRALNPAEELRVGQVYLDAQRQLLHCLNKTAHELMREGVPFSSADLAKQPLYTIEGRQIGKDELPLRVALRGEKTVEAVLFLKRDPGTPLQLRWIAGPIRNHKGTVSGVLATIIAGSMDPDWQGLAGLAHDLRTPLQSLGLLTELAEGAVDDPAEIAELLPRIRTSAQRAISIAQDVLEWCRVPSRSLRTTNREWVALEPFLKALAAEQAVAAEHKSLALVSNMAAAAGWQAFTDKIRLGRLLSNLLANAVRYTTTGQVEFTASWRDDRSGRNIGSAARTFALSIVDTGAGISMEEQESIFQPFERGRAGKEGDSGGSGLGLAIVDRLVEELGLELEVYSEYGRGSAFHLLLPEAALREESVYTSGSPQDDAVQERRPEGDR